ncbi:4-hydroxybenzoate 3-monooxygenase [uncultured Amnibacterium sp.]|uniref:4-hydroxybenzoate 3-monooxygenase n=1 Tax=uncultured Amnibacterium sp. TaxID=1631851 RepID=UPI0035CB10D9
MHQQRTRVAIIGAGPAGLLLGHLLAARGIPFAVVEHRSRDRVLSRVRAGVLEQSSVDVLESLGLADGLHADGLVHGGIHLQHEQERFHIDFEALVGRTVTVYGQQRVQADLMAAHDALGSTVLYDAADVTPADDGDPVVRFTIDGEPHELHADFIVGADGFHGVTKSLIPPALLAPVEREYDAAWLGVLADVPPSTDELIYALHPDGFAMHSMRSPEVSRLYVQVEPDERLEEWSDDRVWDALDTRLAVPGWRLEHGPITEKAITRMRSSVVSTLAHGRVLLVGDAGHIVPPTGAKGLNSAVADVAMLGAALAEQAGGDESALASYSDRALARQWKVQQFSQSMTDLLHVPGATTPADERQFRYRSRVGQLRYISGSRFAQQSIAEQYTGLAIR